MSKQVAPAVSVVLVVGNRRRRSRRALESILAQQGVDRAEIILIDAGDPDAAPMEGTDGTWIVRVPTSISEGLGGLKAEGVRRASAPVVAFLEDHAEARPGWLIGIMDVFDGPWAGAGAEVHNANPEVGIGDAVGWFNYGRWAPPMPAGEAEMLAGNNTIYRRDLLLALGDGLDELLVSDTVLQERLISEGERFWQDPRISILHRNPTTIAGGMKAEYLYHVCYGMLRAEAMHWDFGRKAKYVLLAPAIALLRWLRQMRPMWASRSRRDVGLLKLGLVAACLHGAAVLGQTVGIALRPRSLIEAFTIFELNGPRLMQDEFEL